MAKSLTLKEGLIQIGIEFTSHQMGMLDLYISEIELWNKKYKLVGAMGEQLVIRHILDSLSAIPVLNKIKFSSAADVGSGAGLPGIPVSIFFPKVAFFLIERSGRRAGFLRNIISLLNFGDRVSVIEAGLKDVSGSFDLVLFRAFRNLISFYDELEQITSPEGTMFAYKGKIENIQSEISELDQNLQVEIIPAFVPFLDEERNFCLFRRDMM